MTNKFLLLAAAAGALAFASCQNESADGGMSDEMMQAKVDSAVNARMAEMQAQLAAQNDSLINAMAMMKADSMMAAMSTGRGTTTMPTRPTRTAPPTRNPSSNTTGNDGRLNVDKGQPNNDGRLDVNKTTDNGKKSNNDGRLKVD